MGGGILVVWLGWTTFTSTKVKLESQYGLTDGHVQVMKQPKDCEFVTAPLGEKNCHYEKRIALLNSKGELIGGDEVMPDGKHVITEPKEKVTDVFVNWVKIEE